MNRAQAARLRGNYFQIPLSALAFGGSDKERLNAIISYGVISAGEKEWSTLSRSDQQAFLERLNVKGETPKGFNSRDANHLAAVYGASKTGVSLGDFDTTIHQYHGLDAFCRELQQRYGGDPLVRIKSDLVFEASDGTGIAPYELVVLCAIYSCIGNKPFPVLIKDGRD